MLKNFRPHRENLSVFWILIGCLAVVGVSVIVPSGALIRESFLGPGAAGKEISLANYAKVFASPATWQMLLNTVAFSGAMTVFAGSLGFIFAWIAARTDAPLRRMMPIAIMLPYIIPPNLGAICWTFFLSPSNGIFNMLLQPISDEPVFNIYSFAGMVFVESLYTFPLAFMFFYASLVMMNPSLEEASAVCGGRTLKTLRFVTLPAMWPTIISVATLLFIIGVESFDVAWFVGYPAKIYTISIQVYLLTRFGYPPDIGGAAVFGTIALVFAMIMVGIYREVTRERARFASISGKAYRTGALELGPLRVPASAAFYLLVFMIGVLPILLLLGIALDAVRWPFRFTGFIDFKNFVWILTQKQSQAALLNTAFLAVFGALGVVLISFLVAYVAVRSNIKGRSVLDYLAFLPFGFPSTVLAVGVMVTLIQTPLYNTIWIMLFAFAVKFLPYGLRNLSNNMLQVHSELEEASLVSGAGTLKTLRQIIFPLMIPGMLAAWSLLFIVFARQFSLPIMLSSPGSAVLTIAMYNEYEGGQMGHLAAYGILLVSCALPFLILARWVAKGGHAIT